MAKLTYFNGNGGFWAVDEIEGYSIGAFSGNTRTLIRQGEGDPSEYPHSISLTYANLSTELAETGRTVVTAGTLTTITYRNKEGAKIAELTGLKLDAALADIYIRQGRGFELFQLAVAPGLTVNGSANSSTAFSDWTGDDISTGGGNDNVIAGGGDDYIKDRGGKDTYNGGAGFDTVAYDESFWEVTRGNKGVVADLAKGTATGPDGQKDKLIGIEALRGTFSNDKLTGSKGNNEFMGLAGRDTIDGGAGTDWISYRRDDDARRGGGQFGVVVDLKDGNAAGTARDGWGTTDVIRNIENVEGSDRGDTLRGNAARNELEGRSGDDTMDGRGGNDLIYGDDGNDTLTGGAGNDTMEGGNGRDEFVFANAASGTDRIDDFEIGTDRLTLTGATEANLETLASISFTGGGVLVDFTAGPGSVFLSDIETGSTTLFDLFGLAT